MEEPTKYITLNKMLLKYLNYRQNKIQKKYPDSYYLPMRTLRIVKTIYKNHPYFLYELNNGIKFIGDLNDGDSLEWLLNKNYNKHIINLLNNKLYDGNILVDVGSNIGLISLNITKNINIYAFEPSPNTFKRLDITTQLNKKQNMHIFNKAVGDLNQEITFYCHINKSGMSSAVPQISSLKTASLFRQDDYNKIIVPCITLDSFINEQNISHVNFIKIDVEGFEPNVIRGALKLIQRDSPTILYEYNNIKLNSSWTYNDIEYLISTTGRKYKYHVLHKNGILTSYPPEEGESVDILAECDQ